MPRTPSSRKLTLLYLQSAGPDRGIDDATWLEGPSVSARDIYTET